MILYLFLFSTLFFLVGSFFLNALRKFDPLPTKVAIKRWGEFITKENYWGESRRIVLKDGGYKFLPFFPFMYDAVVVDGSDHNYSDKIVGLRTFRGVTPGEDDIERVGVDFSVPYEVTWYVDPERADKFFQSCQLGGADATTEEHFKRVQTILHGRIIEQLLKVASTEEDSSSGSGRITWEDFYENNEVISKDVIRSVIAAEKEVSVVEITEEEVESVRNGKGKLSLIGLGVCLKRLNLQEPELPEDINVAVRQKEKELRERIAERTEISFAIESIKQITEGTGLSPEAAANLFQSERGKATRNIHTVEGGAVPLLTIQGQPGKKET